MSNKSASLFQPNGSDTAHSNIARRILLHLVWYRRAMEPVSTAVAADPRRIQISRSRCHGATSQMGQACRNRRASPFFCFQVTMVSQCCESFLADFFSVSWGGDGTRSAAHKHVPASGSCTIIDSAGNHIRPQCGEGGPKHDHVYRCAFARPCFAHTLSHVCPRHNGPNEGRGQHQQPTPLQRLHLDHKCMYVFMPRDT